MGELSLAKRSKKNHNEKTKLKQCAFPGCKEAFHGVGRSRYCNEHRDRKYRKIIDAPKIAQKKAEEESKGYNQNIKHTYVNTQTVEMKCSLDGCKNTYIIQITPHVYVYPKYCEEHRNEYRRKRFKVQSEELSE
jgi:hypothetical protein